MADRDLDITKFSYFSYRKLKKTLGEFDAVVECNELAIREFIEQARKEDSKDYIKQLSLKHSVVVDRVDLDKFSSRIRQYYVTSVFQQSEQFLQDFKKEWKQYFPNQQWQTANTGETKLDNVLMNLSYIDISIELIEIYDYYRLVRNYMAHTDRDLQEVVSKHSKVKNNNNKFLEGLSLFQEPNSLDKINYSDFLILTGIVKHIAYLISTESKPNNEEIALILFQKMKNEDKGRAYKGIKKLKNNSDRFEKAIKNYIKTNFGRFSSKDLELICEQLKSLLA
ncbi:hypothetical protein V9L05_21685 (plasmid) [Bernardetia sp. Wsw4-3y2]|uniref:hypothetical protein n=1 Tax=unclassified Bernardetia TaxID=2647129 RepID=UPI0030CF0280